MSGVRVGIVLGFFFLTACGGGGGGTSTPPPTNPPPGQGTVTITGQVQKGPFVAGAGVTISSVSASGATGAPLVNTTTIDDLGSFRANINPNQLVLIEGQGRFLNETNGTVSTTDLSLMAIFDVSATSSQTANVNVLTHLAVPRIRSLLQGGTSAAAAELQSRDEVLAAIAAIVAPPQIVSFKAANLYSPTQGDVDSAYLVTISALFTERARQLSAQFGTDLSAELQVLLDAVADDLSDGVIDYPAALLAVRDAFYHLDPTIVASSLGDLAVSQGSNQYAGDIYLFLDSDLDGVANIDDTDDDNDGIADVDDAYPLDWGCYLAVDGDGSVCNIESQIPTSYVPRAIATDNNGVVYLLDIANNQVVRWSISRQQYGFPIGIPAGATTLAYSPAHDRIFVGFNSGEVLAVELAGEHVATLFATIGVRVSRISGAGSYLVVADSTRNWFSLAADGTIASQRTSRPLLKDFAWSDATNRLYSLAGDFTIVLEYVAVDQQTGTFSAAQSAPNSDDFYLRGLLHPSVDGTRIAAGAGDIFSADTLAWQRSLSGLHSDVAWLADDTIAAVSYRGTSDTRLEHRGARGELVEFSHYPGQPMRVIAYQHRLQVITLESRPEFHSFLPGGDEDGDGVANPVDAFALDPAASLDSDRDGHPDDWNPGKTGADSTTGLTRDAYPSDSACYLQSHGNGITCNIEDAMSSFLPDGTVVDANGVVYLLDISSGRVARWDSVNGHRNPLPFGDGDGDKAYLMRYSPVQHRLYLGYLSGKLTYFDLSDPSEEHYFSSTPTILRGMQPAGNYVWAAGANGHGVGSHSVTFDANGNAAGRAPDARYSRDSAWNAPLARVYLLAGNGIQADIYYQSVDQTTGQIGIVVDSPYDSEPKIVGPIRVSPDGSKVLLGSGDIHSATDLTWMRAISPGFKDAQWSDDGGIVVLRRFFDGGYGTRVERSNGDGIIAEFAIAGGSPIALHRDGGDFRLLTMFNSRLLFFRYRPSNDTDSDGVENTIDAFPIDPSASVDSDSDGYPDAWHAGMSELDSTTGLTLDAYPNDSACYLPEHGDGTVCDIASTIPNYTPDKIEIDDRGIVYLYSPLNRRIYRWDSVTQQHLNPYVIGRDKWLGDVFPTSMAYHPGHDRVYVGYVNNNVKYFDPVAGPDEHYFVVQEDAVSGLAHAGNFLLAVDRLVTRDIHKLFDADGVLRHSEPGARSLEFTWDPALQRIYFFDGVGTVDNLRFETIDQVTGRIIGRGESYFLYDYAAKPLIRASIDGNKIITGAGDLYDSQFLDRTGSLPGDFVDARWLADGSIVSVHEAGGSTSYERRSSSGNLVEARRFPGAPLAILRFGQEFVVVTNQGSPTFNLHTLSDDSDSDGVLNVIDAFPLDPAASADTDGDGYPDVWNAGMTGADSTTGLSLDAYAADSACQLVEQGDGVVCDIASTIPDYVPDEIEIDQSGIVYLFSSTHRRVFRWDATTQQHLNPIFVGFDQWLDSKLPTHMTYHPGHARLYFGYTDEDVTFVDLTGGGEQRLASLSLPVGGLADAGNYLMAFGREDVTGIANILDSTGAVAFIRDNTYWSSTYAWNPVRERLYHFRDAYQNNYLMAKVVNQITGRINGTLEPTNDGTLEIIPPIRVSPDGDKVLIGSGNIFDAVALTLQFVLAQQVIDGAWLIDGRLVTIRASGADTAVEVLDAAYQNQFTSTVPNAPVAVLRNGNDVVVVTSAARPEFTVITP